MKLTGHPYAAKELDKRKFMKNGVLDQKVENEMRIMQKIKHVGRLFSCRNILMACSHFRSRTLCNTLNTSIGTTGSLLLSWNT
jgi:hypothetical protein